VSYVVTTSNATLLSLENLSKSIINDKLHPKQGVIYPVVR